ncbi:Uncharacterised protein [Mycobacterium tuberculosis]|nr:Uncharacterised protein [Mycobacterium tuberculosis]
MRSTIPPGWSSTVCWPSSSPPLRAARNASSASASTVTMWLLAWASAAW